MVAEAGEQGNSQPHIVFFSSDDEDMTQQFFISVEQYIAAAIFFCVVAQYIFNLLYHRKAGDVWLFVQEKVFGLPSKAGIRWNPSTISHFSGIARRYDSISSVEPLAPES